MQRRLTASALEQVYKFVELGPLFGFVSTGNGFGHTAGGMLLQDFAFRFRQGRLHGLDLGEDIDAVAIILHHLRDSANLPFDPAKAIANGRTLFSHRP